MNVLEFEIAGTEMIQNYGWQTCFGDFVQMEKQDKTFADELAIKFVLGSGLRPFSKALFEDKEIFRKADKLRLAHAVAEYSKKKSKVVVIDSMPNKLILCP